MCAVDLVEAPEQVLGRAVDVVAAGVVWEVLVERGAAELLTEEVDLVEEEDDGGAHEPARVDDGVEEDEGLHHAVLVAFFEQDLVVFAEGDAEDDGGDVFEAVDPFFAFTALAADIKHTIEC